MDQQYPQQPQQPNWGQQPTQPGYGYPQPQPQPPKKRSIGKILGITASVFVGLIVIAAIAGGGGDSKDDSNKAAVVTSDKPKAATEEPSADEPTKEEPAVDEKTEAPVKEEEKDKPKVVTFKVWGTAPAGALGPLDISYGSDSDSRKGEFKNGKFEATLPLKDDAMYYNVMAQLQGSGDINCSVTVDGETKSAHASGGYQICNAQLSGGLFGGWS